MNNTDYEVLQENKEIFQQLYEEDNDEVFSRCVERVNESLEELGVG